MSSIDLKRINKNQWFYWGQWKEAPLSADFWLHWGEAEFFSRMTSRKIKSGVIFFDGHYYLLKKDYEGLMTESYQAVKRQDYHYFRKFFELTDTAVKQVLILEKNFKAKKNFGFHEMRIFFQGFSELFGPWAAIFPVAAGVEKYLESLMKERKIDPARLEPLLRQAKSPWVNIQHREMLSFLKQLRTSEILDGKSKEVLLKIAKQRPVLFKKMKRYVKRYEWVGTHNFQGEPYTIEKLAQEILNESKSPTPKRLDYRKPEELPNKIQKVTGLTGELSYWRYHCAEVSGHVEYNLRPQLSRVAKKIGLHYDELILLTKKEILEALKRRKKIRKKELLKRKKNVAMVNWRGKEQVFTGREARLFDKVFKKKVVNNKDVLKGVVGSIGYAKGRVRVILEQSQFKNFKNKEILIAPETTPDFVPIMKKAAAFVTDFGGLTSHAAIVAREMKKPCVIGTQFGTQIFKDGDMVEVDANKGIVRKL